MLDASNVIIEFAGHGVWGVGGASPEDGVYHGTLVEVEYRVSRRDASAKPKLYWTCQLDNGYKLFDFANLPAPTEKPGVEKAFTRFLISAGVIGLDKVDVVSAGGMAGQKYPLATIIEQLKGKRVTVHYLRPRGAGDRHQTTYLYGDEEQKIAAGEYAITDSRPAMAEATASPGAGGISLPTGGATGAPATAQPPATVQTPTAQPPATAQPPMGGAGGAAAAVGNLLNLG